MGAASFNRSYTRNERSSNTGPYLALSKELGNTYALIDAFSAIPFLPSDVFIDGEEARTTSIKLLIKALSNIPINIDQLFGADNAPGLVIRTYLMDRSDFRHAVAHGQMCDALRSYYQFKWLPKRVWITEINPRNDYQNSPDGDISPLGEILLDPSAEPTDCPFLTIHLRPALLGYAQHNSGALIDRNAFDGALETRLIPNDSDYKIRLTADQVPGHIL